MASRPTLAPVTTPDRLERLTDLVLVLLHATSPRTLDEIARSVPGYPESREARRQAFERDKRVLREEGIPVVTEPVEGPEQFGYRIDPDAFYLPDLGLEPDEQAALHLAVAGVHFDDPSGRDALAKLGAAGVAEARPVAALVPPPALATLYGALRAVAEVRFRYHGEARTVAPANLRFVGGRWYLVGFDRGRDAARTFRVDRIEGDVTQGAPGSGQLPEVGPAGLGTGTHGDVELPAIEPWRVVEGDEDEQVLVRVDAVEGPRVAAEVGERAVEERSTDGSVLLRLGVTTFDIFRSWVLGLLDHAEVVGPPAARDAVVSWLEAIERRRTDDAGSDEQPRRAAAGDADPCGDAASGGVSGVRDDATSAGSESSRGSTGSVGAGPSHARRPLPANARLRRLLAIVAWLAEVGEASIHDIATRFDIGEDEVVHELELAACCGLPPYSPDALLEILVTDESVQAFLPTELARPRRLSPAEGLALAASARTILAVPGADRHGALARALDKLQAALGDRGRLVIQLDSPPLLDEVRALVDDGMQAQLAYHSASTDETTERVVEPLAVRSLDGHWYLDAYCHRAGDVRRFRVDRIRRLQRLDEPVRHADGFHAAAPGGHGRGGEDAQDREGGVDAPLRREEQTTAFVPGPGSVAVRLSLGARARWVADTVPVLRQEERPDGDVEVLLAVGGRAWLERLLLQVGPNARVVAPAELADLASDAAARVLRRYR